MNYCSQLMIVCASGDSAKVDLASNMNFNLLQSTQTIGLRLMVCKLQKPVKSALANEPNSEVQMCVCTAGLVAYRKVDEGVAKEHQFISLDCRIRAQS